MGVTHYFLLDHVVFVIFYMLGALHRAPACVYWVGGTWGTDGI